MHTNIFTSPIRILHVFARMDRGGAETMIMNYYRAIDKSKIQFDFMVHTNEECAYDEEVSELGGTIYRVPRFKGYNLISYVKAWSQFLKHHPEYQILHIHFFTIGGIISAVAKMNDVKIRVAHCHCTTPNHSSLKDKIAYPILKYLLVKTMSEGLACSKEAGQEYFHHKPFTVLNNAIHSDLFSFDNETRLRIRNELCLKNKFAIGNIARFNDQKNHSFLIDVFYELSKRDPDAVLILIGTGPLQKQIEDKVIKLQIKEKVYFLGSRADIPELLQAMDVFVFPSLWEGLPVTLIEAQASGLSTIISDVISSEVDITDLIERLSLNQSAKEWAETILKYKNNTSRSNRRQDIINANYDIHANAQKLQDFYLNL